VLQRVGRVARSRALTLALIGGLVAWGCSDGVSQADTRGRDAERVEVDAADTISVLPPPDAGPPDVDAPVDTNDRGAGAGEPCETNDDCETGWCIAIDPRPGGRICLNPCLSAVQCEAGEECVFIANTGGDGASVCLSPSLCLDEDGDGWGRGPGCRGFDCDDTDASVYPGADELCNGRDDNCDDVVDNRPIDAGIACDTGFAGVCADGVTECRFGAILCVPITDGSDELCNGRDDNCNGRVDDGAGCFLPGEPCVEGADCSTGLCVLGTCATPEVPCHESGTCPPRAAATSGGGEGLRTDRFWLEVTFGGAPPAYELQSPQYHLLLGTPAWRNDP
jgi:hypothetical protein